jgi:formylglycine-generating enzyme required for sulfatase activity
MKKTVQSAVLFLAAALLLLAGCGQPETEVPATRENVSEARNQMIAALGQVKSSGAAPLRDLVQRGRGLEKTGEEALAAQNFAKALASFSEARKCFQQALVIEAGMMENRDAALAAKRDVDAARSAAGSVLKTVTKPESFLAAEKKEKEADEAMAKEDFEKARKLLAEAVEGFKTAQADAQKLLREEMSRAALAAKQAMEAARAAASDASKPDARPESFTNAAASEKEAGEALAKEDFALAKDLFVRATERYTTAKADGNKMFRDELSRDAYAKKRDAENERLTATMGFKTDARPPSFVAAAGLEKEGEAALAQEDFAKAKDLFTRAAENYKSAQGDGDKMIRAESARTAWTNQLAKVDAALLERQAAGDFAKLKSQAESAAGLMVSNPGQAGEQLTAATMALKELNAKAKTKENFPKAAPLIPQLEKALVANNWLLVHRTLGDLEQLIPHEMRMDEFRTKAAAVPWPKEFSLDIGGGVIIQFIHVPPGTFTMGEDKEKHQVTLTKPFYIGKYEVTQQQWQAVMGDNPSSWKGDKKPLENVCWQMCQEFLAKLNQRVPGLKAVLPSEAQWEYACRAGTTTKFSFGDNPDVLKEYAVYPYLRGWRNFETGPVGSKKPNPWGLHDMHGNVAEFCSDRFGPYPTSEQKDPQGPAAGNDRVLRGGSCRDGPPFLTSAFRKDVMTGNILSNAGLRLVLVTDAIAEYHASLAPTEVPAGAVASSSSPLPTALPESLPPNLPGATAATSPAAAMTTPAAPVSPDAWMAGIPPNAMQAFLKAQADAKAGKGLLAMRSWRAFWGNKLRDPTRGHVELEFAELLLTDTSKESTPALEEQKKQQNAREAGMIIRTIRARKIPDPSLLGRLEETAKKLP